MSDGITYSRSNDGKVEMVIDQGKHSTPPPRGAGELLANLFATAGFEGRFETDLRQARKGTHFSKGVRVSDREANNAVILTAQPRGNATNREYLVHIPKEVGTAAEVRSRLKQALSGMPEKPASDDLGADDVNPVDVPTPPKHEVEAGIVLLVIEGMECPRTLDNIIEALVSDLGDDVKGFTREDFEQHLLGTLQTDGYLLLSEGVYVITTSGKSLLGPSTVKKSEQPVSSESGTQSLATRVSELVALVSQADGASSRLNQIKGETLALQSKLQKLEDEKKQLEMVVNSSELTDARKKLAAINKLLG